MKRPQLLFLSLLSCLSTIASDPKYQVSQIKDEMKTDVDAVLRENKIVYTIYSQDRAVLYVLRAYTILNENAGNYARIALNYSKMSKINKLSGTIFDANGKVIRKLKTSDIIDRSAFDGYTLYSDNRLKYVDLSQGVYPYTVEFESEEETKYLYHIDGTSLDDEKVYIQHSSYELKYPKELRPHVKILNIEKSDPIIKTSSDGTETMLWSFNDIKPIKFEPLGPAHETLYAQILAAPNRFEYGGYIGDMSSWQEFGKWILQLNKGRDDLSDETKQKVRKLANAQKTTEDKARVLYEYLQGRTRYVNISEKLGGLQPFPASVVDQNGYGDCKALSNFMIAMLKEVGIKGYYVLISAGSDETPLMLDFPSHQFNHATVLIPNGTDTLWLECTSQTNPFGYQGKFTGGRKALMIGDDGGKIVNTIRYTEQQNRQSCVVDVTLDKTGAAKAVTKTIYTGLQYENEGLNFTVDRSYDDQKKWIQKNTQIPSFDILSFSMTAKKDKIPSATVVADFSINRLATVSGKRLFMTPNVLNKISYVPEKVENRKTEVLMKMSFTDLDTVRFAIPEELYPEFLPEPITIQSRFGEYQATFKLDQGKVVYTRRVVMKKGTFPANSYDELIDFYKKITKADNTKLVFLNKT